MTATTSTTTSAAETPSTARLWAGRVVSAIPALMLLMSAVMKLSHAEAMTSKWSSVMGYPDATLTPIGIVELLSVITYAVPKTRYFGAILMTGYLGGAIATHVRIGEAFVIPLALGIFAWLGLWLRDGRLRELTPVVR